MGKKIFVSYKYADSQVQMLDGIWNTTVRNYVDALQDILSQEDHINKGEDDDESMESLADTTIASKLGDKIYDSSVTIVMISKGMKENKPEKEQWIPWEISYSLKEQSRNGIKSKTNAILAVVLPDKYGHYDYFMEPKPECNSTTYKTGQIFPILRKNMFNIKQPDTRECNGTTVYNGFYSYIYSVKWNEFITDIDRYIEISTSIMSNKSDYNIVKQLEY